MGSETGPPREETEQRRAASSGFSFPSLGRHTLVYGFGIVANKAVAFVLLPIYTRYLTPSDYGVLQLLTLILEVVSIVAGARIAVGVFHFFHKAESTEEKSSVITTAMALLMACFGVAALATILASGAIANLVFGATDPYGHLVRLAVLAMALDSLVIVPMAYLQLATRSGLFVGVQFSKLVIQATLNIILIIPFDMGVAGVLWSGLICNLLVGGFLLQLVIRERGFSPSMGVTRKLVRYGYPLMITQVATMILMFGDRYFLNRAEGQAAVGLYGLAHQFGLLILLIGFIPFEHVWNPTRFDVAKRPDRASIFDRAFTYMNLLLGFAAVGVALFAHDVIRIMAAPPFHSASVFVAPITLMFIFQAWSSFHNVGLMITEKTGWYATATWISAVVALLGFLTLIPAFGVWGAIGTGFVAFLARFVLVFWMGQRAWYLPYRWGPIFMTFGWGGLVVLLSRAFSIESPFASIAAHTGWYLLFVAGMVVLPVLSAEEKRAAWSQLDNVFRARKGRKGSGAIR